MAEYLVRLAVTVEAESPEDAVEEFVQSIVASGLRHWVYAVHDADGQEDFGYFDGQGQEIDVEQAISDADAESVGAGEDGDDDNETPAVVDVSLPEGDSEDELVAFARTISNPQAE